MRSVLVRSLLAGLSLFALVMQTRGDESATLAELRAARDKLADLLPSLTAVADAKARQEDAAAVRPVLRKIIDSLADLTAQQTDDKQRQALGEDRCLYLAVAAIYGDDAAKDELKKLSTDAGPLSLSATCAATLSRWWLASADAEAQQKLLTEFASTAKGAPDSERALSTLAIMAHIGPASSEVTIKLAELLRKAIGSDKAKALASELDPSGAQRELLDKRLTVAGRTIAGEKFTSDEWKGKVVLVDFWATWCGPCNAELPRMKELYKSYHAKGLEFIGVDCDADDDTVSDFVRDKEMPWPQLRETTQDEKSLWHPLAAQCGVNGIPTMFLIDKKGVLRFIDAREDTARKIETLLSE